MTRSSRLINEKVTRSPNTDNVAITTKAPGTNATTETSTVPAKTATTQAPDPDAEVCSGRPFDSFMQLKNGSIYAFRGKRPICESDSHFFLLNSTDFKSFYSVCLIAMHVFQGSIFLS